MERNIIHAQSDSLSQYYIQMIGNLEKWDEMNKFLIDY